MTFAPPPGAAQPEDTAPEDTAPENAAQPETTEPPENTRPQTPLRGLLIDYGGVLTTSVFESFHAFEQREGLERSTVARLLRGPDARPFLTGLETGTLSEAQFESGVAEVLGVPSGGLIGRLLRAVRPEETMIRAVRAVHDSGVRTALLSNSWGAADYPLDLLRELFDALVLSGEVALRKPDPEIYRLAARELGLEPRDCVFVDDLPHNLEPAAKLGMATVHHTDPAHTAAELTRLFSLDPAQAR
jgi:epoxide hydrolase-like predicted phosphatase